MSLGYQKFDVLFICCLGKMNELFIGQANLEIAINDRLSPILTIV